MKRKLMYVGTLVDLAMIFEPDEQEELIDRLRIPERLCAYTQTTVRLYPI